MLSRHYKPVTVPSHDPLVPAPVGVGDILLLVMQTLTIVTDIRHLLTERRKDYYSVDEVAGLTGRSAYTVRRWISEGRVEATRIAGTGPRGKLLISREQLQRIVASGLADRVPDAAVVD